MRHLGYHLSFLFLFLSNLAIAQLAETNKISFKLAKIAIENGQFEEALNEYSRIAEQYKGIENWDGYLLTLDSLSYDLVITPLNKEVLPILNESENIIEDYILSESFPEKTAGVYLRLGEWYYMNHNFETSDIYLQKALKLLKAKGINSSYLSKCYSHLASSNLRQGNFKKAFSYSDSLYINAEKLGDTRLLIFAAGYKANALMALRKLDQAAQIYEKAILKLQNIGGLDATVGDMLSNLASILEFQGKSYESIEKAKKALEYYSRNDLSSRFPGLTNIGISYYNQNDFDQANTYNNYALAIGKELYGEDSPELVENYSILSKIEFQKKNLKQARSAKQKAIELRNAYQGEDKWYGLLNEYISLASLEIEQSNYKEASKIAKILNNFELENTISEVRYGYVHAIYGKVALATKNNFNAIDHFKKAVSYFEKVFQNDNQVEMLRFLGEAYLKLGDNQNALKALQSALDILANNAEKTDFHSNPPFNTVIDKFSYANILLYKADALFQLKSLPNSLSIANETLFLADSLISNMKGLFGGIESKKNLAELFLHVQLRQLIVNYTNYLKSNDDLYFEAAFRNSEKIKSLNLLEDFNAGELTKISKIPDSLIKKELDLTRNITFYEKELFLPEMNNEELRIELEKKLFQEKQAYESLLETYRISYKDYFQLKFRPNFISIDEIKNDLLSPNQTIIEFVEAEDSIYIFVINKNNHKLISIEKDFSLEESIEGIKKSLTSYSVLNVQGKNIAKFNSVEILNKYTSELYQKIWIPIEQQADLNPELIIIPDGRLNYIPFEILLKEIPEDKTLLHTYKYLIDDYQISYNYSSTLWSSMINRKNKPVENNLLAFAPTFSENKDSNGLRLLPLKFAMDEIKAINELVAGKIFPNNILIPKNRTSG